MGANGAVKRRGSEVVVKRCDRPWFGVVVAIVGTELGAGGHVVGMSPGYNQNE